MNVPKTHVELWFSEGGCHTNWFATRQVSYFQDQELPDPWSEGPWQINSSTLYLNSVSDIEALRALLDEIEGEMRELEN